jgi:pyridoxal biosynthesis lyase PdxS
VEAVPARDILRVDRFPFPVFAQGGVGTPGDCTLLDQSCSPSVSTGVLPVNFRLID